MANESVKSRYAKIRPAKVKRRTGSRTFQIVLATILLLGISLVAWTVKDKIEARNLGPKANKDHWHTYFGVNVCGTWQPHAPQFEAEDGVHSHEGSSLIHVHPFTAEGAGNNATFGHFIGSGAKNVTDPTNGSPGQPGDWKVGSDSFTLWNGATGTQIKVKNGDSCTGTDLAPYIASATSTTTTTTSTSSAAGGSDSSNSSSTTTTTTTTTTSSSSAVPAGEVKDEKGVVRWAIAKNVTSKLVEKTGNINSYKLKDGEILVLFFLPKSAELVMPPDVRDAFLGAETEGVLPSTNTDVVPGTDTSAVVIPPGSDSSVVDSSSSVVSDSSTSSAP